MANGNTNDVLDSLVWIQFPVEARNKENIGFGLALYRSAYSWNLWSRDVYSCTKFILFPPPFLRFLFPSQYFFGQIDHILLLHSNAEVISWFMAFYGIELWLIKTVISKKLLNLWTSYTLYTPTKGWQLIIIESLHM